MAKDWLEGAKDYYDTIVIGSGLAGLTAANRLAAGGMSVLLLEHHYQLGGLATWFRRKGGHIFDISLHGFPYGMIKSCRKYWSREIADSITQLKRIRFVNPQFDLETTFDREHFTKLLVGKFGQPEERVRAFYDRLAEMSFYDEDRKTTRDLFEEFFPGRDDVHRLLLEPIAYANGSSLDDPALTYGIVFSNFMSKGVFTFEGGTDQLIEKMAAELRAKGVDLRKRVLVERILVEDGRAVGVVANGREIRSAAVISNAHIKNTIFELAGADNFSRPFREEAEAVRVNTSSCQVYMGVRKGESIPDVGDLIFVSETERFSMEELTALHTTSRTFSFYYPHVRPQSKEARYAIVASLNARWSDWESMSDAEYDAHKERLCEESLNSLERFIPGVRDKLDWVEAATPRTVMHYTRHVGGASFGAKFEGLQVSDKLPQELPGLYHAGSVGIIMSGWLGAINYGVIVANKVEQALGAKAK